ncbi:hypothetical protein C1Y63_00840 [Corynebacterium sp. 13CS0277]|uniref:ABC transporter ATP-binding protein n=1 Tax=Corynebacterium sp. 13CS0277 TaxID=2071994 RepID=UPI000D03D9DC|nr:ABC transporter ATP-binding protein [Corynebacterium sp. 13CS0277]PRQ12372.1 hypothetical protein C1Y63_00840 [Corynebacterium sp. 13CS0277]
MMARTHSSQPHRSPAAGLWSALHLLSPGDARKVRRASALVVASTACEVFAILTLVTVLTHRDDPVHVGRLVALAVGATALWAGMHIASVLASRDAGYSLADGVLETIRTTLVALPLSWFRPSRRAEVASLATADVMQLMSIPAHLLPRIIPAVVVPVACAALVAFRDPVVGCVAFVAIALCWLGAWWGRELVARSDGQLHAAQKTAAAVVLEFARLQPTLRLSHAERFGRGRIDAALDRVQRDTLRMIRVVLPGVTIFAVAVQCALAVLIVLAAWRDFHSPDGVDGVRLAVTVFLIVRCIEPLRSLAELAAATRMALSAVGRLQEMLSTPVLPVMSAAEAAQCAAITEPPESDAPHAVCELRQASMRYPGSVAGVEDITMCVMGPGLVAVVGPSGSGKSTLLKLLARFYDCDAGAVLLGGRDVRTMSVQDVAREVSFVFQDTYLMNRSLRDNILVANPQASEEELDACVRACGVAEIAERLGSGLDSPVGEGGERLSGGERQRVAIARAVLKKSPLVLLDEVTSALDARSHAAIQAAIARLRTQATVVMVAHRLNMVTGADTIVVMDSGRVEDMGTHEELVERCSLYRTMWERYQQVSRPAPVESSPLEGG